MKNRWTTVKEWEYRGYALQVKRCDYPKEVQLVAPSLGVGYYTGYVITDKLIPNAEGELDVHGGVTYQKEDANGFMTYGFDCAHWNDSIEVQNEAFAIAECERLADAIAAYVQDESVEL